MILSILPSVLFAASGLDPATGPSLEAPTTVSDTEIHQSLIVIGDDGLPIGGASILMAGFSSNPALDKVYISSPAGQTEFVLSDPVSVVSWVAYERMTNRGRSIGMNGALLMPSRDPDSDIWRTGYISLPIAEAVMLFSPGPEGRTIYASDTATPRWFLSVLDTGVRFASEVAWLPNNETLTPAAEYQGYTGDLTAYKTGIVMVNPAVALGQEGFYVAFDLGDHTFTQTPVIDLIHLADGGNPGSGNLTLTPTADVDQEGTTAMIQVKGNGTAGRWFFLLRDGAPGSNQIIDGTNGPSIAAIPPGGSPGSPSPGGCEDCDVPDATANPQDCVPDAPDPCNGTAATSISPVYCTTETFVLVGPVCALKGETVNFKEVQHGEVSLKVNIGAMPGGMGVSSAYSEKVAISSETTYSYEAFGDPSDATNPCGDCRTKYKVVKACAEVYQVKVDKLTPLDGGPFEPGDLYRRTKCVKDELIPMTCTSTKIGSQFCYRQQSE